MRFKNFLILLFAFLIVTSVLNYQACYAEENPCVTCHADFKKPAKSVHAALGLGCSSCHKTVEGKNHPAEKGSIILTQNMPGLCYSCHEESKFKGGKSGHTNIGMCTGCHNPHASNFSHIQKADQPELCFTCHDKAKFTKKYVHGIIAKGGCTACHILHISDNPSLLTNDLTPLCVTCHLPQSKGQHVTATVISGSKRKYHPVSGVTDPRFPGKKKKIPDPNKPGKEIEVYDPENPGKLITCASCHDPHSSDFRKLFPAANVCQLCHKYF